MSDFEFDFSLGEVLGGLKETAKFGVDSLLSLRQAKFDNEFNKRKLDFQDAQLEATFNQSLANLNAQTSIANARARAAEFMGTPTPSTTGGKVVVVPGQGSTGMSTTTTIMIALGVVALFVLNK